MSNLNEIWKPIPGFDADYQVSNLGRMRSLKCGREKILKTHKTGKSFSYRAVSLRRPDGSDTTTTLHRAIFMAFCGPIPDDMEIDHIDDNPENNFPENLRLVTRQENMAKSWDRRRARGHTAMHTVGTHCKRGHEFTPENTRIAKDGYRYCRQCANFRYQQKQLEAAAS